MVGSVASDTADGVIDGAADKLADGVDGVIDGAADKLADGADDGTVVGAAASTADSWPIV